MAFNIIHPHNLQVGDIVGGAPIASIYETNSGVVVTVSSLGAEDRYRPGDIASVTVDQPLEVTELQRLLRRSCAGLKELRQQLELAQGREQALRNELEGVLAAARDQAAELAVQKVLLDRVAKS